MKRPISLLSILALASCVVPANQPAPQPAPQPQPQAQPQPQPPPQPTPPPRNDPPPPRPQPAPVPPPRVDPPTAPQWDQTGWTLLGERWVNGRNDRDIVTVGANQGTWTKLTVVVSESSLVMDDISVVFGNNKTYSPRVRHTFGENTRTRAIDLPGNARRIKRISFRYGNLPGGGRAKVQVWGKAGQVASRPPPRPRPPVYRPQAPSWNNTGWTKLGERWVNDRNDSDVLRVRGKGAFTHLTLVVSDADVEMFDVTVTFGNGKTWSPNLRHTFRNGTRSRAINLPGHRRNIKQIAFNYGNVQGRKRAKVAVWGMDKSPAYEAPQWNSTGWTKLGQKWVNGRRDRDVFNVRGRAAYTHLTVVVSDSDLSMQNMVVTFGNGKTYSPNLRHVFKNGTRSRAIDLPGGARKIRKIAFNYGNLPGTGRAKVAIYGKNKAPQVKPPVYEPPKWNSRGWTNLGQKWVNGRRDRDVFNLKNKGAFTHLTVVVSDSDLRMFDMEVTFGNGKKWSPNLQHIFKNGSRSRSINLPGHQRNIRKVTFKYGNLPGTGRAKVSLYGKNNAERPEPPKWQGRGWTKLGEKWVNGRNDRDVFNLRGKGAYTHLTVVVSDSDLSMRNMVVTFGNGKTHSPNLRHIFKNGSRSRAINLPGGARNIRKIAFNYGNLPGTGRAKVAIYGKNNAPQVKPPVYEPPKWNSRGWTNLGQKWVNGRRDRDTFNLNNKGAFTHLTVVVSDSDLRMFDMEVTFGNGKKWSPNLKHFFKNGSRSRSINLPGHQRNIRRVTFKYGNLPGTGRAKVSLYGKNNAERPEPPKWQGRGWTKLGEKWVNGRNDRDVFNLRGKGAYTHLTVVVSDSDLSMRDMVVTFGNGKTHSPNLRHIFKNGSRSRAINLPGGARNIRKIAFNYGNLPGTGRAKVAIYGKNNAPQVKPPVYEAPKWQPRGWTKLGEKWVNGRRDKDTFNLRNKGAFTHLTVVVSESDLRMFDMVVTFGNGKDWSPNLKHFFKNGSRSRAINLPGHQRNIRKVTFKYGNLPGTGRAKVAIYGRNKAPKPTKPSFNPRGWTKLSQKWVNGNRDKDVVSMGNRGAFTHLAFVVSESDLRMYDMEVEFGNGTKWSPKLAHIFKNGARSRQINLPGHQRNIKKVTFKYGNLPGSGRAQVTVYGKNTTPKPTAPKWKPNGWTKLGEKWVNGKRDKDVLAVGRKRGVFKAIMVVVSESDLAMENLVVTFGNKQKFSPRLRHVFKNGTRSRKIDLPGNVRNINKIAFKYGNLPGTGRAKVAIWALPGENPANDKPTEQPGWTSKGWSKLGSRVVQGRRDSDSLSVGVYAKKWSSLAFEVSGGDVIVKDVVVTFGNGKQWKPFVRHVFNDGSRSRAIALPKARKIKSITFKYGKRKKKGRPTVTVWAK